MELSKVFGGHRALHPILELTSFQGPNPGLRPPLFTPSRPSKLNKGSWVPPDLLGSLNPSCCHPGDAKSASGQVTEALSNGHTLTYTSVSTSSSFVSGKRAGMSFCSVCRPGFQENS